MSDAQAIPDNLFYYSDQAKNANADLRNWIGLVLAPAVRGYQETAIDFGGNIDGLTAGTGIDVQTRNTLTDIAAMDEQVRSVGQAFLDAGDKGLGSVSLPPWAGTPLDAGDGNPSRYAVITTPDRAIADDLTQHGSQLAQYANKHGVDSYVLQQLKANKDDPYYLGGFYNGLTREEVNLLLLNEDSSKAADAFSASDSQLIATTLASTYAGNTLSSGRKADLAEWLTVCSADRFYPQFMTALASNPDAALGFVNSLSDEDFTNLAAGISGARPGYQDQRAALFINACAAALKGMDGPGQAAHLMTRLYTVLSEHTPPDINAIVPALATLLTSFYSVCSQPPPMFGNDQNLFENGTTVRNDIKGNAEVAAAYAWEFSKLIYSVNTASDSDQVFWRQLEENVAAAGLLALLPALPAAGLVVTAAMVEAAVTGWGIPQVDALLAGAPPDEQVPELRFYLTQDVYAQMQVAAQLLAQGQLVYVGPHGDLQESIGAATAGMPDSQILNWLLKNDENIMIARTDTRLSDALGVIDKAYLHKETLAL